ncbi:hypothetical protein FRACYDRAFT_246910 [Fragilariopsis cylindrus CCMP1102]|uniref:MAM domain-containing protein n=1 Tax=Fragilariopsis cylindrus CCMP1102 TaxID=635003 RepID=A0A1E7EY60_9STRA|nr:hypothetical protein FRACYDRAFT_246910 [Fragilariopsis cylindrus CCMP1102]|eukprot:OEU10473.1 hypothetical protein FRACYDRAFT_246910 [Fragilariopsis cylindrus CCMP1102]
MRIVTAFLTLLLIGGAQANHLGNVKPEDGMVSIASVPVLPERQLRSKSDASTPTPTTPAPTTPAPTTPASTSPASTTRSPTYAHTPAPTQPYTPEGSVERVCGGDGFVKDPAGAPEGNCYAKLSGTQNIIRDFRLCGSGCVSFYFAWNEVEDGNVAYNDFMRVSYVNEIEVSTTLVTLNVASGDKSSWQKVVLDIPDEAVGSVLKFEGLVQNDSLDSWSISGAEGSVNRICDAGAPEGNCYVGLSGTQSITRDFRLCGPGCVSFYFAWNEEDSLPYNDFMRVSYVDEIGDSTTLLTLNVASGDQRSWQKVAFDIPDEAVGSVLKFEGLVQNVQDNLFNSYLFLDDIEVSQGSCPSSEPITL